MTADVLNLLAEIRRSGGDLKLVNCDRLKLIAPTALLPELAEQVRPAKPMLLAALKAGRKASFVSRGGGGVYDPQRNGATAQPQKTEPSSHRAIPSPVADWRARHRKALAHWNAQHPTDEAEGLAWGELECRWHRLYGERIPEWECGGCGDPISGLPSLDFDDGNRVHLVKLDCLIRYGERWRGVAREALIAIGLQPPHERQP